MNNKQIKVGFIGNPNCGKTTLFNAYTGANMKVANWPSVTVEKMEGSFQYKDYNVKLVDLPGTYSLTSYTMEEQISREYVMSGTADVIINVADASLLERNLYLTLQLIEWGRPVILALNMMDILEKQGMEIDLHRLTEMLGIPVIPVNAGIKKGLDILIHTVIHQKARAKITSVIYHDVKTDLKNRYAHNHHTAFFMMYSDEIEDKINVIQEKLKEKYPEIYNKRWHAIKILEGDRAVLDQYMIELPVDFKCYYAKEIINEKYDFIDAIISEVLVNKDKKETFTDKADRILTNQWLGFPLFLGIMALIFFLTFTLGNRMKDYMLMCISAVSDYVQVRMTGAGIHIAVISLVVNGIISGVGGILIFLPNIFILFLALAFLENSGYMSRVAYVIDGIMGKVGLSGRAFIPMILGFGCSVPAIMASRALEHKRDRLKTMLITPLISCSARLPVYVLFSQMFFEKYAIIVAHSMYVIGLLMAVLVAFIIHLFNKRKTEFDLLLELPEYKIPSVKTIVIYVWEKVKDYLKKASTTIFIASIIMWFLMNFGVEGYTSDITQSFGSFIGRKIVFLFQPLGLGYWQIIVALIAGISAKEVVISSCFVLFGIQNMTSQARMTNLSNVLRGMCFGTLNAYCMMIFCLLYTPCIATLATIKKESESWKFTGICVVFQLLLAWFVTFMFYQIGNAFL